MTYPAYLETDFLFVLTKNLHCLLLAFNKDKGKAVLISKGYLRDRNCIDLEPPYSIFLASGGKCIAMMIHQNLLKLIPIVKNSKTKMQLSQAFNIRIRHPEVNQIVPLTTFLTESGYDSAPGAKRGPGHQALGILVIDKKVKSRHHGRYDDIPTQLQLLRYKLDLNEQELVAEQGPGSVVSFVSDSVYHILPLPFGGFLAFDPEFAYLHVDGSADCVDARKMRRSLVFSAVMQYDEYNPETMLTTEGKDFLRFLAATEAGELYMIAFHLQVLKELTQSGLK